MHTKSELRVERGWEFGSVTGAGRKPMAQILGEALTFTGDDRIRLNVRLTARGRIRVARLKTDGASLRTASKARKKDGGVKWRKAQKRMLNLLQQGTLPTTVRQAAKLLESEGFRYNTVRTAAQRSPTLTEHFNLTAAGDKAVARGGAIVDELAQQADRRTKQAIQRMSPQQRAKVEAELKDMPAADALELVKTLASDPDAGSTGDVAYIEEADQDDRDDDK